jgi:hypothetical protein
MTSYFDDDFSRVTAVDYIRWQLQQGKTLAAFLLRHVDFRQGTVVAFTHTPLSMKETLEFGQGHASPSQDSMRKLTVGEISGVACQKPSASGQLIKVIEEQLARQEENICVLENSLAMPEDAWLKRASSRIAIYDNEVYHVLMSGARSKTSIADAIREARGPTVLVGALGPAPVGINSPISRRIPVDAEDLEEFARRSQCVFASAYDGEGYIVWSSVRTELPERHINGQR